MTPRGGDRFLGLRSGAATAGKGGSKCHRFVTSALRLAQAS